MNELAIKMAIDTTTSCQLVQNFLVCAVETSRLHKLKRFGLIGRHSKLYCLCSRDIQNFIVCAIATFKTLLFVQSRHSKLYCLCNRDIQNFIVCAVEPFETFLVCVSLLGLRIKGPVTLCNFLSNLFCFRGVLRDKLLRKLHSVTEPRHHISAACNATLSIIARQVAEKIAQCNWALTYHINFLYFYLR